MDRSHEIDASWIIVHRNTGKAVFETFDFELVQFINVAVYRVMTAMSYLQSINRQA